MGKISIEDFDRKGFAEVGVKYGIALIALCIVWILILEFVFHWKPFKFSILTIARLFHGKKESKIYCILNVVWWIIFASPFAYSIAVGAITANRVNNTILGLIIAIVPCIILLFLLTFKNYSAMGYKSTSTHYILVGCSVILYVVLEIVIVMIQSPRSWMACGYLLSWPSLAIALISICSSRRILKKDVTKSIMNNDEVKADTIRDNAIGSGELGWIRANTIVLTSLIANGVYALLWAHTEHQTSAICIGFGSLFLDCMIVFSQYNTIEQGRTFQLVFVGFVIKYVVVSFSSRFFYIGHAFLIFFLGTIFISRAIKVWLANINAPPKPIIVEENDDVINDSVFELKVAIFC